MEKYIRFLNPKNDLVFKRIFGENPDLLMDLLNSIIDLDYPIIEVNYLPTELAPQTIELKNSIVDVRCTDSKNRHFIVEMQMFWVKEFQQRVLYNASKVYVKQLEKGSIYKGLSEVYTVNILNEIFEPEEKDFIHYYNTINSKNINKVIKGITHVFIELPKCKTANISNKNRDLWLKFLSIIDENVNLIEEYKELYKNLSEYKPTKKALNLSEESGYNRSELDAYDKYWDIISTEKTMYESLLKEGEQIGIKKGKIEGEQIGIKKGKIEVKIEIIKKLILKGLDNESISEITELSVEKIQELR